MIAGTTAVISFVFGWMIAPYERWVGGVQGVVNSLLISIPVGQLELSSHRWSLLRVVRQWPFSALLIAKIVLYMVLIMAATQLTRMLMHPISAQSFGFDRIFFQILLFAGIMSVLVNAFVEVGRLLGFDVLRDLLTGRYHRPRREERVFLLIDMKSSTAAAERLDDLAFHGLMRSSVTLPAALDYEAAIHKYVGDEAILTWRADEAIDRARCVLCAFALRKRIASNAIDYQGRFGLIPEYRAALHIGAVVTGEMGGT